MVADDDEGVIYLGSFSKTFAPGLRVGWACAPHAVREKLVLASEATMLNSSTFSQLLVSRYLSNHPWMEQVKIFRELYRDRRDAMLAFGASVNYSPEFLTSEPNLNLLRRLAGDVLHRRRQARVDVALDVPRLVVAGQMKVQPGK